MNENILKDLQKDIINLVRAGYFKSSRTEREFIDKLYDIIYTELYPEKKGQCNHKPVVISENAFGKVIKCFKCGKIAEIKF